MDGREGTPRGLCARVKAWLARTPAEDAALRAERAAVRSGGAARADGRAAVESGRGAEATGQGAGPAPRVDTASGASYAMLEFTPFSRRRPRASDDGSLIDKEQ